MKFIDEKGRIFGLINIIDLAVIVLIASGGYIIYEGYKNVNLKRNEAMPIEKFHIKVLATDVPVAVAEAIKEGDVEEGKAKIISVKKDQPVSLAVPRGLQTFYPKLYKYESVQRPEEVTEYTVVPKVFITFEAPCYVKKNVAYLQNSGGPVKIGMPFSFSSFKYDLDGLIIDMERAG